MTDTTSPTVHSTASTVLGAGVGSAVGLLIAQLDMYKSAFARKHKVGYTSAAVVSMGVIGGLIGRGLSTKPNPAYITTPNLPPPPEPLPLEPAKGGGGASLTVSPGIAVQTVPLDVQDPVVIHLPDKATWWSMDGAPVSDKTSPIAFTFLGPINHTLVWFDAQGQQYMTSYFFIVNQNSTPSTNA